MTNLNNLKITRTIQTGIMVFEPKDEDQFPEIEAAVLQEFEEQDFSPYVSFSVDDSEFCRYRLSADIEDEIWFRKACEWLIFRMYQLNAPLEHVS